MQLLTNTAVLSVCFVFLMGCASVAVRTDGRANRVYPGVREDVHYLAHPDEATYPMLQWMNIIDIPFSTILDSLLLPFDACRLSNQTTPPEDK